MVLLVEASNGAFRAHEAEVNRALEPNSKPVPCHLHEERNGVAEPLSETVNSKASKSAIIKQSKSSHALTGLIKENGRGFSAKVRALTGPATWLPIVEL